MLQTPTSHSSGLSLVGLQCTTSKGERTTPTNVPSPPGWSQSWAWGIVSLFVLGFSSLRGSVDGRNPGVWFVARRNPGAGSSGSALPHFLPAWSQDWRKDPADRADARPRVPGLDGPRSPCFSVLPFLLPPPCHPRLAWIPVHPPSAACGSGVKWLALACPRQPFSAPTP